MATIADWLDARASSAPPHLMAEVRAALGAELGREVADAPERCVAAAERLVHDLLARDAMERDAALTLLTADALVTFAFEAAADTPATLRARAIAAMQALGTLS